MARKGKRKREKEKGTIIGDDSSSTHDITLRWQLIHQICTYYIKQLLRNPLEKNSVLNKRRERKVKNNRRGNILNPSIQFVLVIL